MVLLPYKFWIEPGEVIVTMVTEMCSLNTVTTLLLILSDFFKNRTYGGVVLRDCIPQKDTYPSNFFRSNSSIWRLIRYKCCQCEF